MVSLHKPLVLNVGLLYFAYSLGWYGLYFHALLSYLSYNLRVEHTHDSILHQNKIVVLRAYDNHRLMLSLLVGAKIIQATCSKPCKACKISG